MEDAEEMEVIYFQFDKNVKIDSRKDGDKETEDGENEARFALSFGYNVLGERI